MCRVWPKDWYANVQVCWRPVCSVFWGGKWNKQAQYGELYLYWLSTNMYYIAIVKMFIIEWNHSIETIFIDLECSKVDCRVHCCLYFISPYGHGLKPLDLEFLRRLQYKVRKTQNTQWGLELKMQKSEIAQLIMQMPGESHPSSCKGWLPYKIRS